MFKYQGHISRLIYLYLNMCPNCGNYFRTPVSNKAHLGVVHVRRKVVDNTLVCSAGSGCDRVKIGVGKKKRLTQNVLMKKLLIFLSKQRPKEIWSE